MYKAYLKAVFEHRDSMRLSYNKERDDYKAEMAMYNKQLKHLTEGDAPPVEPQKPSFFDPFIASPTLNGLLDHLSDCATAGIFSDEGTKFVNSYDNRDVKTGISLAANLCNLWDGSELSKDTGIEKARLFNRRCNLLLLLQKTEAANLVNNDRLKGQGFESRTLVVDSPEWILKKIDDVYEANKKAGEAQ